jgi:hypothetical protein
VTELVDFLKARLDEDERTARGTMWEGSGNKADWEEIASATLEIGVEVIHTNDRMVNRHVARWDPARVLAEVDAKRRILDTYEAFLDESLTAGLDVALHLLALPYDQHPDYRQEWAP